MKKARSVRFLQTFQVRPLLGLNSNKLPKDERCWVNIKGLCFHLLPATPTNTSRPHRLQVQCNCCKTWVSAGRFNQHQATHPIDSLSQLSLEHIGRL